MYTLARTTTTARRYHIFIIFHQTNTTGLRLSVHHLKGLTHHLPQNSQPLQVMNKYDRSSPICSSLEGADYSVGGDELDLHFGEFKPLSGMFFPI